MAILPASFAVGLFPTSNNGVDSLRRFASTCHLSERRTLNHKDRTGRQRYLVSRESASHAKRCPYRKLNSHVRASSNVLVDKSELGLSEYLFRTENGDRVKVALRKKTVRYLVSIEVFPLELNVIPEKLIISWGMYRSDSSSFIPLEFQSSPPNGQKTVSEAPITRKTFGTYTVEMEFESYLAPFYLSFVLRYPFGSDGESSEIKTHRHTDFRVPVGFGSGNPVPLGLSFPSDNRVNFAFFSRNVESVNLCLFDDNASEKPALEIELDPYVNRTGDIWHVSMDTAIPFVSYGYRCKGSELNGRGYRVLLDPYSKLISKKVPGIPFRGELRDTTAFDWSRDVHPGLPMEKLVVYRLNVMHFTCDKSSNLPAEVSGTFSGVTEKLQHLKDLGINAILLEPIFPCNEKTGPYFPFHFFSPMQVYGPGGDSLSAINSLKEVVKRIHASGIEVYLEVVFTHTAEDGSFHEIDYSYSYADGDTELGARDALNCNYPIVQQLIVDSLRYWVTEFHIDGFCFLNASYLLKGSHGESLSRPPLVETIAFDPILSKTKIIADYWDPNELSAKEIPFPHWKRWAEMNSEFSVDGRNFVRGEGLLSSLATRLCGSGDIFATGRGPAFSFNYIARNSGLPLVDLVSYSQTELASELSWNCGEEGPTNNKVVLERRLKQIRNFLFILFVSLGVPVLNMGDECGLSSGGSPSYSDRKHLNWAALNTAFGVQITRFISYLSSLRERRSDLLQKREFLKEENINWHDLDLSKPKWDDPSAKFLAMVLKAEEKGDLFVAFNAGEHLENVTLPSPPEEMEWVCLVDTALPFPGFFSSDGVPVSEQTPGLVTYEMKSYSSVLFEAKIKPA